MAIIQTESMIRATEINNLVSLLSNIKDKIDEDKVKLKNCLIQLNGVLERYYTYQDTQLHTAEKLKSDILILERKKTNSLSADPRCNVHDIAEDTRSLIDSIIDEIKALGIPKRKEADDHSVNVSVLQNQKQSQHQDVVVSILLEATKDELTGRQRKEILEIVNNSKTPEEARKSIFDKLKEYGEGVSASIVANMLTNPSVWSTIGSLL